MTKINHLTLSADYEAALSTYVHTGGEENLLVAYELGRTAIEVGLGVLDMLEFHHRAMKTILSDSRNASVPAWYVNDAMDFLQESLSPFEITHRGYLEAVESMQRVTHFARLVYHEVRSPLTSILSSAGMLREMLIAEPNLPYVRLLSNVLKGVNILKSRTDDLVDVAGFYSGSLSIHVVPVDIAELMRNIYARLEPEVKWRGMTMHLRLAENLPVIEADPDRLQQVITNLIQNATRYAADGGRIELSVSTQQDKLMIEVTDYGQKPSVRVRDALTDQGLAHNRRLNSQTGIGLILCKQIVDAHHGEICVTSNPNKGSTFRIILPLLQEYVETEADLEGANR